MEKEEIIELIRSAVAEEFGESRIKKIEAFGPYEDEDLNVMIYVEGIEEVKDTHKVWSKLFDKLDELDLDVPFSIARA